jgi:hypothetical protein
MQASDPGDESDNQSKQEQAEYRLRQCFHCRKKKKGLMESLKSRVNASNIIMSMSYSCQSSD